MPKLVRCLNSERYWLIKSFKISTIALDWTQWGCIQAGLILFQNIFLTGVVLAFEGGEVLFKSGVAFKRIR